MTESQTPPGTKMNPPEVALNGLLELPHGFTARIVQREGDRFDDGFAFAAQPDGMACLDDGNGHWVLLRNHELGEPTWLNQFAISFDWLKDGKHPPEAYRNNVYGGVSRVLIEPEAMHAALAGDETAQPVVSANAILTGTDRNCAGGMVDRPELQGWISCEESDEPEHGWAFLTRIDDTALVNAEERRLRSWGRFKREAVALDPTSGVAWMTEDHQRGLFYRHVPVDPTEPFGDGRLEALCVDGLAHTDPNLDNPDGKPFETGTQWGVRWVPIDDPTARSVPCREQGAKIGATAFNRVEGTTQADDGDIYFIASTAGPTQAGQIFRLRPGHDALMLISQVTDRTVLSMPDNVTVAPWGDLVMAEDNYDAEGGASHQHIRGLRPDGTVYDIAKNLHNRMVIGNAPGAEFAGVCFSPDGQILFVNLQSPENVTVAITGDWESLSEQA